MTLFRFIRAHLSSLEFIQAHSGSFSLFKFIWALLCPFNLDSFQLIKYILEEMPLIYVLLIRCKLYAAAFISLQYTKKNSNVSIFVLWLLSSLHFGQTLVSKYAVFLHIFFDPYIKSRLNFSNFKQTFLQTQLLEINCERSPFSDVVCS